MGQQINARDWIFQVSPDPSIATPVWTAIGGLESFTIAYSEGEESADTTTFASAGNSESKPMQRGGKLTLEGKVDKTNATTQDAGQVACDNLAKLVGDTGVGGVRFRHTSDTNWTIWRAWASKGDAGGGKNDQTSWGCAFTRSGAATTATVVP